MSGRASWRAFYADLLGAFPDLHVTIDEMIADDDTVAVRWRAEGTHRGEFLGVKATGRKVPMNHFDIFQVENGQITGALSHVDALSMFEALGVEPGTSSTFAVNFAGAEPAAA